jgi:hypothetical protein
LGNEPVRADRFGAVRAAAGDEQVRVGGAGPPGAAVGEVWAAPRFPDSR